MKDFLVRTLIIVPLIFGACAPSESSRHDPTSTPLDVTPTYEPPKPTIVKEQGFQIARGATQLKEVQAHYDAETKSMRLSGALEYIPVKGGNYQKIDLNLVGMLDEDGFIVLQAAPEQAVVADVTIAAKATCLSEEGTCSSSFIDIYLYTDGVVYHQQIETKDKKETPAPTETPTKEDENDVDADVETDVVEYEGGADVAEGEAGPYIGSVHEDIENILKVKPTEEAGKSPTDKGDRDQKAEERRAAEKKAAEKKAAEKKEEPKKEEPKKEEPKKEDPKKTEPKKDDTKKEPTVPTPVPRPEHDGKKDDKKEEPVAIPKIASASQVVGSVNSGRLENGVDMKKLEEKNSPVNFHIIRPERKRYFATNEISYLVQLIGKLTGQMIPGYKLAIGDISKATGGKIGTHDSHMTGLDADIAFYFNNKSFQGYFASALEVNKPHQNWMVAEQWKLYKHIVRTQLIDRIFIHETLKKQLCSLAIKNGEVTKDTKSGPIYETLRRLIADQDHITHFHMRAKCSRAQVRCRPLPEARPGTGCF